MKTTVLELVCGLAAGVAEGVAEKFIPGSKQLTRTINDNLKTEAPLGVMTCEAVKPVTKKVIDILFFI